MPISDYEELDLTAMNIDEVGWGGSVLRAEYGDGFGDEARNGSANGLHKWALTPVALTDDVSYNDLVDGQPSFAYYWDFFKRHTTGTRRVFLVEFRGRKYFAEFVETGMQSEVHTSDLYSLGYTIKQRRVAGYYEGTDGCVFDPSFIEDKLWGWFDETSTLFISDQWADKTINANFLSTNGDSEGTGSTQNGRTTVRLADTTADGFYNTAADPTIYDAFFMMKVREATFSTYQGILTADVTTAGLVGNTGDTKMLNLSFGAGYEYRKNSVLLTEATQNAPMNAFAVIHARWTSGITLANLQIGKDRNFAGRYLKADIGEIILCDQSLTAEEFAHVSGFLMYQWGLS